MVIYKTRPVFTSDGEGQGRPGKGTVYFHMNAPEDAQYIPDCPGDMVDQIFGIQDWWWDNDEQKWVKIPRAEDDPRGPEEPSE